MFSPLAPVTPPPPNSLLFLTRFYFSRFVCVCFVFCVDVQVLGGSRQAELLHSPCRTKAAAAVAALLLKGAAACLFSYIAFLNIKASA